MSTIKIGNRLIGKGQPCFLVAEIGINHNGDLNLARHMIDAALACGADAVKFQNYRTENMVMDRTETYAYRSAGVEVVEPQFDMFKRCELRPGELAELVRYAKDRGIICFSTPMDEDGVAECVAAGCEVLKNGSDCLSHLPLIECMACTGLPTMISTGMAVAADIDDAVAAYRAAGGKDLVVLHCTSAYPTPYSDVNLAKIESIEKAFGTPVGFSDHTIGIYAGLGAVARGAVMIEKHFTTDRMLPGPDHSLSATPEEFGELVRGVRALEASFGSSVLGPAAAELEARQRYRLSCAARTDLPAGHRLTAADITFLRPGTGFAPKQAHWLIGERLSRPVRAGTLFTKDLLA